MIGRPCARRADPDAGDRTGADLGVRHRERGFRGPLHLQWGRRKRAASRSGAVPRIGDIVFAVLAAAGATAFLRMQYGGPMRRGPLIAGWIGSSATFAQSLILITGLLLAGEGDSRAYGPAGSLVVLLALLCGLAGAAVGMIRLEGQVSRAAAIDEGSELATR